MKIFFTTCYLGGNEPLVFPLGLAYLKSALSGHDVCAVDLNTSKAPYPDLAKRVNTFAPDVVGISLRNIDSTNKRIIRFYYPHIKEIIQTIKAVSPARIIIGGSGFSMFAETIMKDEPRIDLGVYLEGERSFPKLLNNLDQPEKVPGVFYRKQGKVLFSGQPEMSRFDDTVTPDFSVVPMAPYRKVDHAVGVQTKRGCALKCIYCIYPFLNGRCYRLKPPLAVVDEIEVLVRRHKVHRFMFVDSVFNAPMGHARKICEEMIRRRLDVTWSAWLSEKRLDREFVQTMVDAGCRHAIFSPDAMDDEVLEALGKNIRKKEILVALKLVAAQKELEISYNFFKNPPGQNLRNFLEIVKFILKNKYRLKNRIHFELSAMRIEPHTGLHKIALRENAVTPEADLLQPSYYINRQTRFTDLFFNTLLRLKGK